MKDLWLRVIGASMIALMAYLFLSVVIQYGIVPFEYAAYPIEDSLVSADNKISKQVSYALWRQRYMDMIVLALLLFVTAACCALILREGR